MIYDLSRRRRSAVRPSPVFLGVLALAIVSGIGCWVGNDYPSRLADFSVFTFVLSAWVVTLSLHEFAHAYAAFRAGDRSVEAAGYLTLNPLKYAHPLLSIVLPLLFIVQGGIGLPGGAVYLHRHSFRSKASQSLAAAAGPLTNLAFGAIALLAVQANLGDQQFGVFTAEDHPRFWAALAFFGFLQITAAVLNLLPIPGLDGWAIIEPYLDPATVEGAEKIKPWGMIGVIILLQVDGINRSFFDLVDKITDRFGVAGYITAVGHQAFRFWAKFPL